jgi:hypothetical protein
LLSWPGSVYVALQRPECHTVLVVDPFRNTRHIRGAAIATPLRPLEHKERMSMPTEECGIVVHDMHNIED